MDYPHALYPSMLPLEASFTRDDTEEDLKRFFIDLFASYLAESAFDANVLGAAHLGSIGLVQKSLNQDGLLLLQGGASDDASSRYLYRAWKSGNAQGRGLHFLKTYLQLLFPNDCEVRQLWGETLDYRPYPQHLHRLTPGYSMHIPQIGDDGLDLDGEWNLGEYYYRADGNIADAEYNTEMLFPTSRVQIILGPTVQPEAIEKIGMVIRSIVPARFVIVFSFWIDRVLSEESGFDQWFVGEGAGNLGDRVLITHDQWINR